MTAPDAPSTDLDPRLDNPLERLKFYGNNGYGPDFDRSRARHILADLATDGLLDRHLILGAMAAARTPPLALARLDHLMIELAT